MIGGIGHYPRISFAKTKKTWFAELWQNEVTTHHSEKRLQTMSKKIVQLNEEITKGQLAQQRRGNPQRTAGGRGRNADQVARDERNE